MLGGIAKALRPSGRSPALPFSIFFDMKRNHLDSCVEIYGEEVEAALMVETGSYRMYDALIVVAASPDTQITRVMQRDGQSREAAERVLAAQLPLQEKEAVATAVIRNDGTLKDLQREVDACWERLGLG